MPNSSTESEIQEVKFQLSKLEKFLEDRDDWQNLHNYIIIEYFPTEEQAKKYQDYIPNVYNLYNLKLDSLQDDIVIFSDIEGILEESMNGTTLRLFYFLLEGVTCMMFHEDDTKITISFEDGFIQILY